MNLEFFFKCINFSITNKSYNARSLLLLCEELLNTKIIILIIFINNLIDLLKFFLLISEKLNTRNWNFKFEIHNPFFQNFFSKFYVN